MQKIESSAGQILNDLTFFAVKRRCSLGACLATQLSRSVRRALYFPGDFLGVGGEVAIPPPRCHEPVTSRLHRLRALG